VLVFLSDEWLAALDEAAAAAPSGPSGRDHGHLVIQQIVSAAGEGDRAYYVMLDDGHMSVRPGRAEDPTVVFSTDLATARSIASGEQSAQTAFIQGRLRLGGDAGTLVRHAASLGLLDEVFAPVRDRTRY
jgi:hypothetical protein